MYLLLDSDLIRPPYRPPYAISPCSCYLARHRHLSRAMMRKKRLGLDPSADAPAEFFFFWDRPPATPVQPSPIQDGGRTSEDGSLMLDRAANATLACVKKLLPH